MKRPAASPAARGPDADRLAAAALLLLAVAIRALVISRGHQLDIDESDTALKVAKPVAALIEDLTRDGHPPLYFFLLKGWTAALGSAEWALRGLSLLFSAGTLLLLIGVARDLFGRRAALIAGILFALSPIEIFHASEGRMYTLLPLEALAAFALTGALLSGAPEPPRKGAKARAGGSDQPAPRGLAAALFGVLVAGLYTHNYGLFIPAAVAASAAAATARRARGEGFAAAARAAAWPLGAVALSYFAYLPWLPVLQGQRASGAHLWLVEFFEALPPILAIPRSLAALAGTGPYPPIAPPLAAAAPLARVAVPVGAILFAAGIAAAVGLRPTAGPAGRRPEGGDGRIDARRAAAIFPLVLLGGPWLVSVTVKVVYLVGRYDVIALPFVVLLLGAGASALAARGRALLAAPALVAVAALPGVAGLLAQPRGGDVVEQVRLVASRPTSRAVIATQLSGSRFRYYLTQFGRPDVAVRNFPTSTDRHPGWLEKPDPKDPATAADADALARSLLATLKPGEHLWAVLYDNDAAKEILVRALARRFAADAAETRLEMGLLAVTPP